MEDPNGAEKEKGNGVEGESKDGAKGKSPKPEASSPKTYSEEDIEGIVRERMAKKGWDNKKLEEEVKTLKEKSEKAEAKAKDLELTRIAEKYGVDLTKAKELGFTEPELLEKAVQLSPAGKETTPTRKLNAYSGKNEGGGFSDDDLIKEYASGKDISASDKDRVKKILNIKR